MVVPTEYESEICDLVKRLNEILEEVDATIGVLKLNINDDKYDCGEGDCEYVLSVAIDDFVEFKNNVSLAVDVLSGKKHFSV